jgi:hypothetical protein
MMNTMAELTRSLQHFYGHREAKMSVEEVGALQPFEILFKVMPTLVNPC